MKAMILAAVTMSIASIAAADPQPNSDVEARLAALERIDVTAYKPQQATDEAKDPQVDAILENAARAEDDENAQPQSQQ
jgi:hypothetical protein